MRFKLPFILLLTLNLLGCATVQQGSFTTTPVTLNKAITKDCINRLLALYPPARTRFHIKQSVKDSFGVSLIEGLRQKGYSINESSSHGASSQGSQNVALYYLVDEPIKGTLYRVTLIVGQQSLSRAYKIKNGTLTPLGFWVRKE
ncbi:hypothetical protein [Legionella rowbothamii]|uniref:hypothetical protein n=1 Tax=Legionella rowbothamii TaxID=96229 RepID=UPI001055AA69|nr:hypothetical protein [Legionella rowbothamii]